MSSSSSSFQNFDTSSSDSEGNEYILSEDDFTVLPNSLRWIKTHRPPSKPFSLADFSGNSMTKTDEIYRQLTAPKMPCLECKRLTVAIKNKDKEAIRTAALHLFVEDKNAACGNSTLPNSGTANAKLEESQEHKKKLEELEELRSEVTSSESSADISESIRLSERTDIDSTLSEKVSSLRLSNVTSFTESSRLSERTDTGYTLSENDSSRRLSNVTSFTESNRLSERTNTDYTLSEKVSSLRLSNLTAFTESFRVAPSCSSTNEDSVISNVADKFNHFAVNDVDPVPDSVHSNPTSSTHHVEIFNEVPSAEKSPDIPEKADVDNTLPKRCSSLLSNLSPFIEGFRFAQAATVRSVKDDFDDSHRDFKFEEFDPMKKFPVINQEFRLQGGRIFDKSDSNSREDLFESAEPQKRKSAGINPLTERHCTCHAHVTSPKPVTASRVDQSPGAYSQLSRADKCAALLKELAKQSFIISELVKQEMSKSKRSKKNSSKRK